MRDEEEDSWDESILGPKDSGNDVFGGLDKGKSPDPHILPLRENTTSNGRAAPPGTVFSQSFEIPLSRSSSTTSRRSAIQFEDEEEELGRSSPVSATSNDSFRIRQEALRVLEVADEQLSESAYSVYRTSTGGYSALAKDAKHKPAALSGFSFAKSRKNLANPFRDDTYTDSDPPTSSQLDYENGEDRAVVDVDGMENRFAASRQADSRPDPKSWSSRYSIEQTLTAMSGGSTSTSRILDQLDKEYAENRRAAANLFLTSPVETRNAQVFGSGFSFRQNKIFGKQGVLAPKDENLKSVYNDPLPEEVVNPAKSWQEDFQRKRRTRRNLCIAVGFVTVVFIVVVSSVLGSKRKRLQNPVIQDAPGEDASVTFYVTSDTPLTQASDQAFTDHLNQMSKVASFFVHLGDIQVAQNTSCTPDRYQQVATLLKTSPIPAFIVPGEEDWVDCPDQKAAWTNWATNFNFTERFFNVPFNVLRFDSQVENFAFVVKNVLFIGVHETNGAITDIDELNNRNGLNVQWIKGSYMIQKDIRALVIFGNGRPSMRENDNFYVALGEFLYDVRIPTAYIHSAHDQRNVTIYKPFRYDGMDHVIAIQSASGENGPPLRINVGFDVGNTFIIG